MQRTASHYHRKGNTALKPEAWDLGFRAFGFWDCYTSTVRVRTETSTAEIDCSGSDNVSISFSSEAVGLLGCSWVLKGSWDAATWRVSKDSFKGSIHGIYKGIGFYGSCDLVAGFTDKVAVVEMWLYFAPSTTARLANFRIRVAMSFP